ncbi:MAG: flagellar hook-associated protein FlgK [Proteobacteria bacterium]|nr:flagellar hook-associated protein FlgK [Pseudomonadota bacterium]
MGTNIFGIGVGGLNAAQAGLVTTGHNITNASTPGFSRQEIVQSSNIPQLTGAGFLGSGVQVSTVKRLYSDFMSNQVNLAQTQGSQLDSYYAEIKQIDNMLGDVSAGLSPALQDFFNSVNGVAANPTSMPSRQAMISGAEELAARFQSINQRLSEIGSGINGALQASVSAINSFAQQIAKLNNDISLAEAATNMQPANDLRDQRDSLVAELAKEIRATTVKQSDGSYNIFVGNGQPIVVGKQTFDLVAASSLEDAQRMEVGYKSGASTVLLGSATLQGGNLGGLIAFRSETLDVAQNAIGRVAIGVAQSFNTQHALGQDLNGALGSAFFTVASPGVLPRSVNAGTATVSASFQDVGALTTSDYRLQFNGTAAPNETYTLTRLADGVTTPISFPTATGYPNSTVVDGLTITIAKGATGPTINDTWTIQPTRTGARDIALALKDPARLAAASPVRANVGTGNAGTGTIVAGSVSSVANLPTISTGLAPTITLTYAVATNTFTVTGLAAGAPAVAPITYAAGSSMSVNGMNVTISGSVLNGDTFTIVRNSGGVSDNSNAVSLAGLQTKNSLGATTAGGQALLNFQQAYAQMVSQVGNKTRQMQVMATAQENLVAQTKQAQQSIAGVNLDDEAANLLRYQQAYQASGKMMQIATSLFQTLLDLGR